MDLKLIYSPLIDEVYTITPLEYIKQETNIDKIIELSLLYVILRDNKIVVDVNALSSDFILFRLMPTPVPHKRLELANNKGLTKIVSSFDELNERMQLFDDGLLASFNFTTRRPSVIFCENNIDSIYKIKSNRKQVSHIFPLPGVTILEKDVFRTSVGDTSIKKSGAFVSTCFSVIPSITLTRSKYYEILNTLVGKPVEKQTIFIEPQIKDFLTYFMSFLILSSLGFNEDYFTEIVIPETSNEELVKVAKLIGSQLNLPVYVLVKPTLDRIEKTYLSNRPYYDDLFKVSVNKYKKENLYEQLKINTVLKNSDNEYYNVTKSYCNKELTTEQTTHISLDKIPDKMHRKLISKLMVDSILPNGSFCSLDKTLVIDDNVVTGNTLMKFVKPSLFKLGSRKLVFFTAFSNGEDISL